MSIEQAVRAAYNAGITDRATLITAVAIAGAESGYDPNQRTNTSREDSRGLWQINVQAHPEYSGSNLYDPNSNAAAMVTISSGGSNWQPWSVYSVQPPRYLEHVGEATTAVDKFLSTPGGQSQGGGTGPPAPTTGPGSDCWNKCAQQFPTIGVPGSADDVNFEKRKACYANCGVAGDSAGGIGGSSSDDQQLQIDCRACSVQNLPACFGCISGYLKRGLQSFTVNIVFIVLILIGIYLLFKDKIDNQVKIQVENAKEGAKTAVKAAEVAAVA